MENKTDEEDGRRTRNLTEQEREEVVDYFQREEGHPKERAEDLVDNLYIRAVTERGIEYAQKFQEVQDWLLETNTVIFAFRGERKNFLVLARNEEGILKEIN